MRSVTVRVQSEGGNVFDLGGVKKSTRYVVKFALKNALKGGKRF